MFPGEAEIKMSLCKLSKYSTAASKEALPLTFVSSSAEARLFLVYEWEVVCIFFLL
jgi:hypothetical protein